jgi:hypothetical protein
MPAMPYPGYYPLLLVLRGVQRWDVELSTCKDGMFELS